MFSLDVLFKYAQRTHILPSDLVAHIHIYS